MDDGETEMKQVVRYKCDFCDKIAVKPETIQRHERECIHNPDCVNCFVCKFSTEGGYTDTVVGSQWVDNAPYCQLHSETLQNLRHQGHTALNCADFVKDEKMYYERSDVDADENIEKYYSV